MSLSLVLRRLLPSPTFFGVSSQYTSLHASTFLLTSALGISLLVFINAAQAFVLTTLLQVPRGSTGRFSGSLVFAEELLVLPLVLVWGRVADRTSPRLVTVLANLIAGLALFLFVQARNVYPQLLLARLLFAVGSSGITSMLSAQLSLLCSASRPSASPARAASSSSSPPDSPELPQPALGWSRPPPPPSSSSPPFSSSREGTHTRLAAFLGTATGLGALLAVFGYLRIPNALSRPDAGRSEAHALRIAFYLVGGTAALNALIAGLGLPSAPSRRRLRDGMRSGSGKGNAQKKGWIAGSARELKRLGKGFALVKKDRHVALGYAAGFAARAQTITTSAFVPLYVAAYYRSHGLCGPPSDPSHGHGHGGGGGGSSGDLKTDCRLAYSLASSITGLIQLVALLSSPLLSIPALARSPAATLAAACALGALSFAALGREALGFFGAAGSKDPRNAVTWLAGIGIGFAQIAGIVLSLAIVAGARRNILSRSSEDDNPAPPSEDVEGEQGGYVVDERTPLVHVTTAASGTAGEEDEEREKEEIAGALAGAYSFSGGLGVLLISGLGGLLADKNPTVPFLLMAGLDVAVVAFAGAVALRDKKAA